MPSTQQERETSRRIAAEVRERHISRRIATEVLIVVVSLIGTALLYLVFGK